MDARRSGRWAFSFTTLAVVWGLALVPAAFWVPVYGGGPDRSLVAVNRLSWHLLAIIVAPALLAAVGWVGLRDACVRGGRRGVVLARASTGLLGALTLLGIMTVGLAMLPVLGLLIAGLRLTPVAGA